MIEPRSGVWWTDIDTTRGVPGIPFRALLAITLHRRIECCALQLRRRDTAEPQQPDWIDHGVAVDPDVIDADAEAEPHADFGLSAFTAQDINAAAVLPRWLPMAAANPIPLAAAEGRDTAGALQSDVVNVVNAAETLHRRVSEQQTDFPFAQRVKEELLRAKLLNSHQRARVVSAVELSEVSLEQRLRELVLGLGEQSAVWLLNGQVAAWAKVAATVRNALSHGYSTPHHVEQDDGALIGVLRTTQRVIRLRLLVAAGSPAACAGRGGPAIRVSEQANRRRLGSVGAACKRRRKAVARHSHGLWQGF